MYACMYVRMIHTHVYKNVYTYMYTRTQTCASASRHTMTNEGSLDTFKHRSLSTSAPAS